MNVLFLALLCCSLRLMRETIINGHRGCNQIFRRQPARRAIANLITGEVGENLFLCRQRHVNSISNETTIVTRYYNLARIFFYSFPSWKTFTFFLSTTNSPSSILSRLPPIHTSLFTNDCNIYPPVYFFFYISA